MILYCQSDKNIRRGTHAHIKISRGSGVTEKVIQHLASEIKTFLHACVKTVQENGILSTLGDFRRYVTHMIKYCADSKKVGLTPLIK